MNTDKDRLRDLRTKAGLGWQVLYDRHILPFALRKVRMTRLMGWRLREGEGG
jgi:hypothetical protein